MREKNGKTYNLLQSNINILCCMLQYGNAANIRMGDPGSNSTGSELVRRQVVGNRERMGSASDLALVLSTLRVGCCVARESCLVNKTAIHLLYLLGYFLDIDFNCTHIFV